MNISRPAENRRIKAEYQHIAPRKDSRAAISRAMKGRNLGILFNRVNEYFKGFSETHPGEGMGTPSLRLTILADNIPLERSDSGK